MTIELRDVTFYSNGNSGASVVVGYEDNKRRVARYTFVAPAPGANGVSVTFHTTGKGSGAYIPLRYYIGTDPDSHANAGPGYAYTGELALQDDWLTFTGVEKVILIPGKTYYLWVFPGEDTFGWYGWARKDYISTVETEGAAFVLPVAVNGAWRMIMLYVAIGGKWFLLAPCAVKDGKWHYIGPPE
jgi:hypothetical protein